MPKIETAQKVFGAIIVIESETDYFPLVKMRRECAPDYLKRMDSEMGRYIEGAREDILDLCHEIIQIFRR